MLSRPCRLLQRSRQARGAPCASPVCRQFYFAQCRFSHNSSISQSKLSRPLPEGTWDTHMHVIDPRFPLAGSAQYEPTYHTVDDMHKFYANLGIKKMVFVQPSPYGTDNSCHLDALKSVGPTNGRAVFVFDPKKIDEQTLSKWHEAGVRGARVNLVSVGREVNDDELRSELTAYAKVLRPLNWTLQLYIPLKLAMPLRDIIPDLGVKVVIDHFGSPILPKYDPSEEHPPQDPYELRGFEALLSILQKDTWVKLSAPYRLTADPSMRDLDPYGRELVKEAPDSIVYATDWPHTRFENIDATLFIEKCYSWCENDSEREQKLFRTNAEELFDVS